MYFVIWYSDAQYYNSTTSLLTVSWADFSASSKICNASRNWWPTSIGSCILSMSEQCAALTIPGYTWGKNFANHTNLSWRMFAGAVIEQSLCTAFQRPNIKSASSLHLWCQTLSCKTQKLISDVFWQLGGSSRPWISGFQSGPLMKASSFAQARLFVPSLQCAYWMVVIGTTNFLDLASASSTNPFNLKEPSSTVALLLGGTISTTDSESEVSNERLLQMPYLMWIQLERPCIDCELPKNWVSVVCKSRKPPGPTSSWLIKYE